jgi:glycosyltransferase involved in cell wall biosynthesis
MSPKSLRILITCDWYNPTNGGGAERVAYEVGRRLAAEGHQITVLATQDRARPAFPMEPGMDLEAVGAYSLASLLRAQVSVSPGLFKATSRAIAQYRPEVIWAHSLQFQTTVVAAAYARRCSIPLVVTAHIGDLGSTRGLVGLAARMHEAVIGRLILRAATRATAVSNPVAAHVRSLSPGLPVDVVPNGVDLERFRPRYHRSAARWRVGYLGRLVFNKGPAVAIRALRALVDMEIDAELTIAGEGPEASRLRRLANRLGLDHRVRFEGFRADPEVWLQEVDVLVRPSLTEGLPLSVLEAMAAGVPVVATNIPPHVWLMNITDALSLVPVGEPVALAQAVARLALDPVAYGRLRSAGIAAAASFTWDRTSELMEGTLLRATDCSTPVTSRRASAGAR